MKLVHKNISFLFLVNVSNYIFPLLTLPYTARVLGPISIGELALAQAFVTYFTFIVDFGFNITATRDISSISDKKEISKYFSLIIVSKFLIFMILVLLFFITSPLLPISEKVINLVSIGLLQVFGSVIFPVWFFQGIQKMSSISIGSTIAKLISAVLIFVFVKGPDDIYQAMLFQNIGAFIAGLFSIYIIMKYNLVNFSKVSFSDIPGELKKGGVIFISFIFSSCYTTLNTFFLSFTTGAKEIGYFSSADKLRAVSQSVLSPIQQAVFPHIASQRHDLTSFKKSIYLWGGRYIAICSLASISLFIFSPLMVKILLGDQFLSAIPILKMLSPLPVIISIAIVFGQWGLVNLGMEKILTKIYIIASILHLCYVFVFIHYLHMLGLAISILITEALASGLMVYFFYMKIRLTK